MLLSIKNISKRYKNGIDALSDVSLDVEKGEFISIIGPSGSGKSTLLRSINKMIDVTSGSIYFENHDITNMKKKEIKNIRREMGMIFQNYNLVERLTAIENVLHGQLGYKSTFSSIFGLYSKEEKKETFNLLEKVNMTKYAYQKCSELSGGQKQRIGIARAIMQNPKLLLCDEPIASLDPKSSENVMDYLKKIVTEMKITCIINLHQVDIAKKYSTRIVALNKGKKVFDGKVENLTDKMIEDVYKNEENE